MRRTKSNIVSIEELWVVEINGNFTKFPIDRYDEAMVLFDSADKATFHKAFIYYLNYPCGVSTQLDRWFIK